MQQRTGQCRPRQIKKKGGDWVSVTQIQTADTPFAGEQEKTPLFYSANSGTKLTVVTSNRRSGRVRILELWFDGGH